MTRSSAPKAGDALTWLHEPRGGYGYTFRIPVVVVKVGAKRVQVEAPLERGGTKRVWVTPDRLLGAAPNAKPEEVR